MTELDKILIIGTLEIAERKILDHADHGFAISQTDVREIFEDLRQSILKGEEAFS